MLELFTELKRRLDDDEKGLRSIQTLGGVQVSPFLGRPTLYLSVLNMCCVYTECVYVRHIRKLCYFVILCLYNMTILYTFVAQFGIMEVVKEADFMQEEKRKSKIARARLTSKEMETLKKTASVWSVSVSDVVRAGIEHVIRKQRAGGRLYAR